MTLTAGTTLHHGKYQINAVLDQKDWGVTYQALHLGLNQPVVVQSVYLPKNSYPDPDQFLSLVSQRLDSPTDFQINVLECFIESEMLFLVLQQSESCPVPNLRNWVIPLTHVQPTSSPPALHSERPSAIPSSAIAPVTSPAALSTSTPKSPESTLDPETPDSNLPDTTICNGHTTSPSEKTVIQPAVTAIQQPTPFASALQPSQGSLVQSNRGQKGYVSANSRLSGNHPMGHTSSNSASQTKVIVLTAPTHSHAKKGSSKFWIPISLGLTSLAAGLAGASFGWALRTQNLNSTNNPSLLSPILNNEQSFPPIEGWVGDDPVDLSIPLTIPEEPDRFNRRRYSDSVYPEQDRVSEDIPEVRSPLSPQETLEETPLPEPLAPLPDTTNETGADPQLYAPAEPTPSPTPEFVPIPPKIKPDSNPPETYQLPVPPSEPDPAVVPNVNGVLSDPDAQ